MKHPATEKLYRAFPLYSRGFLITGVILLGAAAVCTLLRLIDHSDVYVSMIFLLAVLLISRMTDGYFYGILASLISVFGVNFAFTYPYFAFNFTISGYPLAFITMLATSIITSAMTTQIKEQERLKNETEREKMRGNLLRAVSHDLRTPLTAIVGATSAVLENEELFTPEERRELLTEVKDDAQWLIRMVENLLSITRMEGGEANIGKSPEAAEEVVAEAVRKFKKQFTDVEVAVSVPDELLMVPMDAILIEQVIINLLENAVLHGKKTTLIRLCVLHEGETARFSVEDNGAGIDPAKLPTLFDGYLSHRDSLESDGKRNMGIGLSVCMTIVKAHGGELTAQNLPAGGALFQFSLPL